MGVSSTNLTLEPQVLFAHWQYWASDTRPQSCSASQLMTTPSIQWLRPKFWGLFVLPLSLSHPTFNPSINPIDSTFKIFPSSSACQCRGHGFEPWSGKIPRAAEQLGPWATVAGPARLEPVLCSGKGRDSERPAQSDEEWPPLAATGESPRAETKTQHSHK